MERDAVVAADRERARIAALRSYGVLDMPEDRLLKQLAALAATVCGLPFAVINLVDADRQWQAAAHGFERGEVARTDSFCTTTIEERRTVYIVDAREDPRFATNPHTTGVLASIRTYAAAPLWSSDGYALGTVCSYAEVVQPLQPHQLTALASIADQAAALLELRRASIRLADATEELGVAFEAAPVGMGAIGPDGRWRDANPALARLLGTDAGELIGRSADEHIHPEDRGEPAERRATVDRRWLHPRQGWRWVTETRAPVRAADGTLRYVLLHALDVTERKRTELDLLHRATHDPLTGLPNRSGLVDRLAVARLRLGSVTQELVVMAVDLDAFKVVNDAHGHATGDAVLVEASRRISTVLRTGDMVFRVGGDELVVVCEDVRGAPSARDVAQRIVALTAEPMPLDDLVIEVGASVGAVVVDDPELSVEELLLAADTALYAAKARGRGRVVLDDRTPPAAPGS